MVTVAKPALTLVSTPLEPSKLTCAAFPRATPAFASGGASLTSHAPALRKVTLEKLGMVSLPHSMIHSALSPANDAPIGGFRARLQIGLPVVTFVSMRPPK